MILIGPLSVTKRYLVQAIINTSTHWIWMVHCLISNREGLGTSLQIRGLATIDSYSQKEHTEIHKIPKFGVNQASFH